MNYIILSRQKLQNFFSVKRIGCSSCVYHKLRLRGFLVFVVPGLFLLACIVPGYSEEKWDKVGNGDMKSLMKENMDMNLDTIYPRGASKAYGRAWIEWFPIGYNPPTANPQAVRDGYEKEIEKKGLENAPSFY